jgi:hypothetical protein
MSPKNTMPDRLARLDGVLGKRVSQSGGWPHWLHIENASTSLVGTAHALAMLRMRGREHNDELVQGGLHYLAREVEEQARPGARGGYARYPAYTLWGLMRFPGALAESEILDGARFSASWLLARTRPAGAWTVDGVRDDDIDISLPATMAAVHGLDRMAPVARGSYGKKCEKAAYEAREAIVAAAGRSKEGPFWRQRKAGTPCLGATSLAVLTLAGGDKKHRDLASEGFEYLRAHNRDWTTSVHVDDQLDQLTWRIMTFSLGLRALLHPCAANPIGTPIVRKVVGHFDALWDEETGAWAVQQGHDASTTGSYAVLSAVRALKNAWEFDPHVVYKVPRKDPPRRSKGSGLVRAGRTNGKATARQVRLIGGRPAVYILDPELSSQEFYVVWDTKAKSQWEIFRRLLDRKAQANRKENPSQYDYTLSVSELAGRSDLKPGTVERTIRRINERIAEVAATEARIRSFPRLVEKIIPGDSHQVRYGIEETEVVQTEPPEK